MIRQALIDDVAAVAELFDAYRVWYGKTSDLASAKTFLKDRLTREESVIFVALPEDQSESVVGFTQCYPMFSSVRMQPMWVLNDLFVAPEYRGRGLSKELIEAVKDLARRTDAAGILLETETTNEIGNCLYPHMGFEREENHFYFWTAGPT